MHVGSLGIRWVLMQHAEPWLLTVHSKLLSQSHPTSDRLKIPHNSSLMRKRCRRESLQETEEPPAKRSAVDKQEGADREDVGRMSSDTPKEKLSKEDQMTKQKERKDEGSGDELLNLEEGGGKQLQPQEEREEEAGEGKVETERGQQIKEVIAREDSKDDENQEACSPPTGPAGVDV